MTEPQGQPQPQNTEPQQMPPFAVPQNSSYTYPQHGSPRPTRPGFPAPPQTGKKTVTLKKPVFFVLIASIVVALIFGFLLGAGLVYQDATQVVASARNDAADWKKKYEVQKEYNEALSSQVQDDSEEEGDESATTESQTALLVITDRKTIDYYGSPGAAYVVQNTSGQTLYNVTITVSELDAAGVVHQAQTLHLGGQLDAGQYGSLEGSPSSDDIVAFRGNYLTYSMSADDYWGTQVQLNDEPILKIR